MTEFRPIHLTASPSDFEGNQGKGRFLLLPGSRARAEKIAQAFDNHQVRTHPRGHDLHLGTLNVAGKVLDIGSISTGMGCPSIDLIVTELIALGAKVMLRVGTSGSLQSHVHAGDLVVATGAVRDEAASDDYLPREFPALPSFDLLLAAQRAKSHCQLGGAVHFGPVHTKDTLYGREFAFGPRQSAHEEYNRLLTQAGVMASEMECAHLFVLGQLGPKAAGGPVTVGAILAVIGERDKPFSKTPQAAQAEGDAIALAVATLAEL